MKKLLVLVLAIAILFSFAGCSKTPDKIRIGTAGTGGIYEEVGKSISTVFNENGIETELKNTAGSAANLRLLSEGYLDLAIAQEDIANDAYNGTGSFQNSGAYKGYSAVAELYTEAVQIVVRKDSSIKSVDDLRGKIVSIGEKESGSEQNATQILGAFGITTDMLNAQNLNYVDAAKALTEGKIDAFFVTIGTNTKFISELQDVRLIPIDASKINALTEKYSYYNEYIIPAGTYNGIDEDIITVGIKSMLFASDKLSSDTVEKLTTIIFENIDKIRGGVSTNLQLVKPENGFSVEVHTGASTYYTNAESICRYTFTFDMYQTTFIAVLVLLIGMFLRKKIAFLRKFCIPAPVVGGLLFAILTLILYSTKLVEISFNDTLREICMVMFFTSVGFQANMKVLKSGGKSLLIFLILVIVLIVSQNGVAIGLAKALGIDPLIGLCTGSIPMVGGHGTAGAFGPVLEDFGVSSATTVCTAAATFGLLVGSIIGGPIGNRLITKKNLKQNEIETDDSVLVEDEEHHARSFTNYAPAVFQLVIAIGIGTAISYLLSLTGMTFPIYIGAMIAAAIIRNIGEYTGKIKVHMGEINDIGGICLSLFLGIAMIMLKLWQLADLALPLLVLLAGQTIFMIVYTYFVVFRVMGKDYDAAVITSGTCGFGMGATPNAMANMQALCDKYYPSVKAYLLIPIIGSLFADFINSLVITLFINVV